MFKNPLLLGSYRPFSPKFATSSITFDISIDYKISQHNRGYGIKFWPKEVDNILMSEKYLEWIKHYK